MAIWKFEFASSKVHSGRPVDRMWLFTNLISDPYDESIVSLTNELARQLSLSSLSFTSVVWETGIVEKTRGRMSMIQPTVFIPIPSDGALFRKRTIYLAKNMQRQLSLEEWKPLITSALINYRKLQTRKIIGALTITLPVIVIYIAAWFVLTPLFPTTTNCAYGRCAVDNPAWNILVIASLPLAIGLIVANVVALRKFRGVADKDTAAKFGTDHLIASLRKVSEVSTADHWSVQRRISMLSPTQNESNFETEPRGEPD